MELVRIISKYLACNHKSPEDGTWLRERLSGGNHLPQTVCTKILLCSNKEGRIKRRSTIKLITGHAAALLITSALLAGGCATTSARVKKPTKGEWLLYGIVLPVAAGALAWAVAELVTEPLSPSGMDSDAKEEAKRNAVLLMWGAFEVGGLGNLSYRAITGERAGDTDFAGGQDWRIRERHVAAKTAGSDSTNSADTIRGNVPVGVKIE